MVFFLNKRLPQYLTESHLTGNPAPDFFLPNMTGDSIHLSALKGKRVVLNFWATWCGPCKVEIPILNGIYEDIKRDRFELISITMEDEKSVSGFLSGNPIRYPIIIDSREIAHSLYKITVYPTFVFIDEKGVITDIDSGMNPFLKWKLRYLATGNIL